MKFISLSVLFLLIIVIPNYSQNNYIIDHSYAKLDTLKNISTNWIDKAKRNLHIRYEHSSHGSQIITGMQNLDAFMGSKGIYLFGNNTDGKLDIEDFYDCDLSNCFDSWDSKTRNYLDATENADCNVIIWSWCNILGINTGTTAAKEYISKMEQLIAEYGIKGTKITSGARVVPVTFVFMTGHVNGNDGGATEILNDSIRNHCKKYKRFLYDFADIESWNPNNESFVDLKVNDNCDYIKTDGSTGNWALEWINGKIGMSSITDASHDYLHGGKWYQCKSAHTQPLCANLKAYGAWYLFVRILGYADKDAVPITSLNIHGLNDLNEIKTDHGSLQMIADILPANASNKYINWSVISGNEFASINNTGLLTAKKNGTVTIKAEADDGSGSWDTCKIAINNQLVHVSGLFVSGQNNVYSITTNKSSLQMVAQITPSDATNKNITWSFFSATDKATISSTGLLTAIKNGVVIVKALANDGSNVWDTCKIYISNQIIPVTNLTVKGKSNIYSINTDKGTLQMVAEIIPTDATNQTVTWSVFSGSDIASINSSGLLTAQKNGTIVVKAISNDGSNMWDTCKIYVTNQKVLISQIIVSGTNNINSISVNKGTLQMAANISPTNATNKTVTWSITSGSTLATLSSSGLLTALNNGTVIVKAVANDGSGSWDTCKISLSNQLKAVSQITIYGTNNTYAISSNRGTLQMVASILPTDAANKSLTWSISSGAEYATLSNTGLLTAQKNGIVVVKAIAVDGSGTWDTCKINILNQLVYTTGITISTTNNQYSISSPLGTLQLIATVQPSNASSKTVQWSINTGPGLATIDANGKLTALKDGTVSVKALASDGSGIYAIRSFTITNQSNGIQSVESKFKVYPNPVVDRLIIENSNALNLKIHLIDQSGRTVVLENTKNTQEILPMNSLNSGLYVLCINLEGTNYTFKIIKQ